MEHWAKMGYYTLAETLQSKNITQHSRLKIGLFFLQSNSFIREQNHSDSRNK